MKILLNPTGIAPTRATAGSAAYDLYLDLGGKDFSIELAPGKMAMGLAGFCMALPKGKAAQILPRSGLGTKGLNLANTVGLIDSDYRGQVGLTLKNTGNSTMILKHGDRVMQMLIVEAWAEDIEVVDHLDETERGTGGFGSTGS